MQISQSMMKSYESYLDEKECGLLFKAKFIDKSIDIPPSAAMKEGIYFEYLAIGSLPKNKIVPEPEFTSKGKLTTNYERIPIAANFFKQIIKHYKIKINNVGYTISSKDMTGTLDIWAEWDGEPCIIDLKYTGLIDDKWNELGWETESLNMKNSLMIQGLHYKVLVNEVFGLEDVPFYYFIFNSKDPTDMKIIHQVVDPNRLYLHKKRVLKIKESIENSEYYPIPSYRRCKDCPLKNNCEFKFEYPEKTIVYY